MCCVIHSAQDFGERRAKDQNLYLISVASSAVKIYRVKARHLLELL